MSKNGLLGRMHCSEYFPYINPSGFTLILNLLSSLCNKWGNSGITNGEVKWLAQGHITSKWQLSISTQCTSVHLTLQSACDSLEKFGFKSRFWSSRSGLGPLQSCSSDKFSGNIDAGGQWITLRVVRLWTMMGITDLLKSKVLRGPFSFWYCRY